MLFCETFEYSYTFQGWAPVRGCIERTPWALRSTVLCAVLPPSIALVFSILSLAGWYYISIGLTSFPHSRFGPSSLHQRDPRSALFEGYNAGGASSNGNARSNGSVSPNRYAGGGYGYSGGNAGGLGVENPGYRPATPNKRFVLLLLGADLRRWQGDMDRRETEDGVVNLCWVGRT